MGTPEVRAAPGVAVFQQTRLDRILAIVDGNVIMHSDVRAFIDLGLADIPEGPDQEANTLTYLIERRLVLDRVDRFVVAEPSAKMSNVGSRQYDADSRTKPTS